MRAKARRYYTENRVAILERAAARRTAAEPAPPRFCSECGVELEGRRRLVCSSRCAEARRKRVNPEAYAANEARKVERRREKRRATSAEAAEGGGS
jgi:hypothetical protein